MEDEEADGGQVAAGRQLRLLAARGELAEARAVRMMRSCAAAAAELRESETDQTLVAGHALRTTTMLKGERLLQSNMPAEIDLGTTFSRYATHFLIGSDTMVELQTSAGPVVVDGEVCRWVMLIAAELLHAIETTGHPSFECRAGVAIDHVDRGIVMSVIAYNGQERPVPRQSGADAIARVSRLMKLFGEFVTSCSGSDVVYQATFHGRRVGAEW